MNDTLQSREQSSDTARRYVTDSHTSFVEYYEERSLSPETRERFQQIRDAILRQFKQRAADASFAVADVGCGAGAQAKCWTSQGHRVYGLDVNRNLIAIARSRSAGPHGDAHFVVGSATSLPWRSESMDVCLVPELLEHVRDWRTVCTEAARVVKPGGMLFISTTNRLCPVQDEYTLPGYSWYPGALKRYCERLAVTTHPRIVNFATYPAVHWFTYFELRDFFAPLGFECMDRFDLIDPNGRGTLARMVLAVVRSWARALARARGNTLHGAGRA